jgi:hypothetical protein
VRGRGHGQGKALGHDTSSGAEEPALQIGGGHGRRRGQGRGRGQGARRGQACAPDSSSETSQMGTGTKSATSQQVQEDAMDVDE